MKQQISPIIAIIAILVVVGLAAFTWSRMSQTSGSKEGQSPGMPTDVAAKFKELGGNTGPNGPTGPNTSGTSGGMTAPSRMGGMTAPPGGMGGMTAPNGGMTAPNGGR